MSSLSDASPALRPLDGIGEDNLEKLRRWMDAFSVVLVAYSGGVDSALVLAVAHQRLGNRAIGCIGVSPSYPQRELDAATGLADRLGIRYRLVQTQEHLDPRYAANPADRCYYCKGELYQRLASILVEEGGEVILDGTNASDLLEHRAGYTAAKERGVRSPLAELGITKDQVRRFALEMELPVWDKPASPCLASRVPTGVAIVPLLLSRIEKAEDALARLGFKGFRVRHHGDVARIELPEESLGAALDQRAAILAGVRAAGYRFVSLDLAGLQSGALNS